MRIEYVATSADVGRARSPRLSAILWPVPVALIGVATLLLFLGSSRDAFGGALPGLVGLATIVLVGLPALMLLSVRLANASAHKELSGPRGRRRVLDARRDGLAIAGDFEERLVAWREVYLILSWRGSAYLMTAPVRGSGVVEWQFAPGRAFGNGCELERFLDLARQFKRESD